MTFKLLLAFCGVVVTHTLLAQQSFPTPEDAGHALLTAVENDQLHEMTKILGVSEKLVFPNSSKEDHPDCEMFVQKYKEMHRFHKEPNGKVMLYIGAENWPFPIPLEAKNGGWQFDPKMGEREILYRRVGDNEMAAIDACHGLASKAATKDAALEDLAANANVPGAAPVLIHGYRFRAITPSKDGRLAFIAYPAEYRSSGVMTFVVTERNVVYEKDLGPQTSKIASHMTEFHEDPSWYSADRASVSAK
jgi:hypothetical protein